MHDSMSESITTTNEVLENFGMAEGESGVDMPSCLRYIMEETKNRASVMQPEAERMKDSGLVSTICFFQSRGILATFVCKCGCGSEISVETLQPGTSSSGEQQDHSGGNGFGHGDYQPATQTVASAPMPVFSPAEQSLYTPPAKIAQHVMQPQVMQSQAMQPQAMQPQTMQPQNTRNQNTRKEKRKVKNKHFFQNKRLSFGAKDGHGQSVPHGFQESAGSSGQFDADQSGIRTSGGQSNYMPPAGVSGQVGPRQTVPFNTSGGFQIRRANNSGNQPNFQQQSGQVRPRLPGTSSTRGTYTMTDRGSAFVTTAVRGPSPSVWKNPRYTGPN